MAHLLAQVCGELDTVLYAFFKASGDRVPMHETFMVVSSAQNRLLVLLDRWSDDASDSWPLVDAVAGRRSEAPEDIRQLVRRTVLLYAASMLRRYELPLLYQEKPLHDAVCDLCSPSQGEKDVAFTRLCQTPYCCKSFFARRLCNLAAQGQEQPLVQAVLKVRHMLQLTSTKVSEASHAQGQKTVQRSQKPLGLAAFARRVFLARVRTSHTAAGGNSKWAKLSNAELVRRSQAVAARQAALAGGPAASLGMALGDVGGGGPLAIIQPAGAQPP